MKEEEFGLRGRIEGGRAFPHPHSGGGVWVWCPAGACPQKQKQERASIAPWGLSMGGGRTSSIASLSPLRGIHGGNAECSRHLQHAAVRRGRAGFAAGKGEGDQMESLSHYSRRVGFLSEARSVSESRNASRAAPGGGRALHPHREAAAMCVITQ